MMAMIGALETTNPPHPSPPSADDDNGNGGNTSKRRKNRPGRSSRRRKYKARSILMEATGETIITTNNDVIKDSLKESVVPTDRSYTLEGVKVRRKEEWLKRRKSVHNDLINNNDVSSSFDQVDEQQTQHIHDEGSSSLDPIDECQLKAQLGYVPGNAICVAARTSLEESFNISDAISEIDDNLQASSSSSSPPSSPPSVLKLYPMAVRETYRGGTTDGRKFKGRRRGVERSSTKGNDEKTDDSNNQSTTNNTDSKKAKKERCWFIESPSNGQAAVATKIDTVAQHDDDDDKEAPEAPKHIIEPFPTTYWLTSPKLRTYISKMELSKDNNVQTIERRLRSSQEYLNQMERAHKSYGRTRWQLLTSQDRERVIERGWENALDERRGVAGISLTKGRFDCVKCLHAHAAHYLAQVAEWEEEMEMGDAEDEECNRDDLNLVGKWTMEAVEKLLLEKARKEEGT